MGAVAVQATALCIVAFVVFDLPVEKLAGLLTPIAFRRCNPSCAKTNLTTKIADYELHF